MNKKIQFFLTLAVCLFGSPILSAVDWEPPFVIGTAPISNEYDGPFLVADPAGNSAVVWVEGGNVFASYRPANGFWESPTNLQTNIIYSGTIGSYPGICIDDNGNITIAFIITTTSGGKDIDAVYTVYRPANGGWQTPIELADGVAGTFIRTKIACTSQNTRAIVTWLHSDFTIIESRFREGQTWQIAQEVFSQGGSALVEPYQIGITQNGTALLIGYLLTAGPYTEGLNAFSTSTPGGAWSNTNSPITGFEDGSTAKFGFDLAPNGNGVIFTNTGAATTGVSLRLGGIWGNVTNALNIDGTSLQNPGVSVDGNGQIIPIWRYNTNPDTVQINPSSINNLQPNLIALGDQNDSLAIPMIFADPSGSVIIGWINDTDNNSIEVILNRGDMTDYTPTLISANVPELTSIVVNRGGTGFIAWQNSSGIATVTQTATSVERLIKGTSRKRLIYQKGLYP